MKEGKLPDMSYEAPHSHIKLLVVDDDRGIRTLISKIASGWKYETEECESAEAALSRLEHSRFNIVLTDIKMDGMDGITFAEKLRESMPSTAVIIMTGYPSVKTAKKSQDMGAIYYMQKPLDLENLGTTLRIAAAWNIGMLTDRAAQRFLALRKDTGHDHNDRLTSVKIAIKRLLSGPGWMEHLRNFVYAHHVEANPLFSELRKKNPHD